MYAHVLVCQKTGQTYLIWAVCSTSAFVRIRCNDCSCLCAFLQWHVVSPFQDKRAGPEYNHNSVTQTDHSIQWSGSTSQVVELLFNQQSGAFFCRF